MTYAGGVSAPYARGLAELVRAAQERAYQQHAVMGQAPGVDPLPFTGAGVQPGVTRGLSAYAEGQGVAPLSPAGLAQGQGVQPMGGGIRDRIMAQAAGVPQEDGPFWQAGRMGNRRGRALPQYWPQVHALSTIPAGAEADAGVGIYARSRGPYEEGQRLPPNVAPRPQPWERYYPQRA